MILIPLTQVATDIDTFDVRVDLQSRLHVIRYPESGNGIDGDHVAIIEAIGGIWESDCAAYAIRHWPTMAAAVMAVVYDNPSA